jgi:hypothetical protein
LCVVHENDADTHRTVPYNRRDAADMCRVRQVIDYTRFVWHVRLPMHVRFVHRMCVNVDEYHDDSLRTVRK